MTQPRSAWSRRRLSRRSVIRGGTLGTAGAIGAVLIGCGDDDEVTATPAPSAPSAPGTTPSASGAPAPGEPKHGGVARQPFLTADDPAHFDAHQSPAGNVSWFATLVYDQLVQFDPANLDAVIPNLAASWETPEPTTIVFHLNEAVFHDGTPFTSEDVANTMERVASPPEGVVSVREGQFRLLERVETPDDRTAVFHLSAPSASIFGALAQTNLTMYATKDLADIEFHRQNVNGTGPFIPDRIDQGSLYRFTRNPNYYEADLPYLDGFEYHIIPEVVARFAAFQSGNLDLSTVEVGDRDGVRGMSDTTLLTTAGTAYWATTIATWKEPWTDERTWTAVGLAINKDDFNQASFQGESMHGGPMPPGSSWALTEDELLMVPGYKGLGDGQESDMDARWTEARRLLDAAGVAEGTRVELLGRDGSASFENWALVSADGLQHVGLDVNINLFERGTYDDRLTNLDYGDMAANSRGAAFVDPSPVFADSYIEGAGRHYTGLVIPEVEELFVQQESELDIERRFELQNRMQKAFLEVYPAEISVFTAPALAHWNYVHGYGELYGGFFASRKNQWMWLDR